MSFYQARRSDAVPLQVPREEVCAKLTSRTGKTGTALLHFFMLLGLYWDERVLYWVP